MTVAVIGSGPVGMACAKGLVERGLKVDVIDAGEVLDDTKLAFVDGLKSRPHETWSRDWRRQLLSGLSKDGAGIPRRRLFGADFVFAEHRAHSPSRTTGTSCFPTYAKGGYSTIWGASILPIARQDISDWPIALADIEPYFRKVMNYLPVSAAADELEQEFPIYRGETEQLPVPAQCTALLERMRRHGDRLRRNGIHFGASRLAVQPPSDTAANGCTSCGYCFYGCAPSAIYSAAGTVDAMHASGDIRYRPGLIVKSLEEGQAGVVVGMKDAKGKVLDETYDAAFLALGALNTTRLLINALRLWDRDVILRDSQKCITPLITSWSADTAITERKPTLPGIFLEYREQGEGERWSHVQIYGTSPPVLARLGIDPDEPNSMWGRLASPLAKRLMLAWVSLHSDHSGHLSVRLTRDDEFTVVGRPNPRARTQMMKVLWTLFRNNLRLGALLVPYPVDYGQPGAGHHIGASFPMRRTPATEVETDVWGRPKECRRIFAVDSTILPAIPASTVTLTAMANAWRIAAEAPLV